MCDAQEIFCKAMSIFRCVRLNCIVVLRVCYIGGGGSMKPCRLKCPIDFTRLEYFVIFGGA